MGYKHYYKAALPPPKPEDEGRWRIAAVEYFQIGNYVFIIVIKVVGLRHLKINECDNLSSS